MRKTGFFRELLILVLALTVIAAIFGPSKAPDLIGRPAGDPDEAYRVYSSVLQTMVDRSREKLEKMYIWDSTSVPKQEDGIQQEKFNRAMERLAALRETRADFWLQNLRTHNLEARFTLKVEYELINAREAEELVAKNRGGHFMRFPIHISAVGFSKARDQALVTIDLSMIHSDLLMDFLMTKTPSGDWRIVRASGGRNVMD